MLYNHGIPFLLGLIFLCSIGSLVAGQPPATQPLLIYNCAKMPSICRNVNQRNPLLGVVGNLQAGNLGRLNPGNTPGGLDYLQLTYDTNNNNKRGRRNAACPSRWKLTHPCPEGNQPPTVASGDSWTFGGYIGQGWNRAPLGQLLPGQAGYNVIADLMNTGPSGMMWTCDEWPPAITTQGGQNAVTYCAPQNGRCGGAQFGGTMSEQDIQGNIHSALRLRLTNVGPPSRPPTGTYPFSFQTEWDDTANAVSAVVVWSGGANAVAAYKRSLEPLLMYVDVVYGEGAVASFSRPMTEDEIRQHIDYHELLERELNATNEIVAASNGLNFSILPPIQQRFETLHDPPPLPIIDITRTFVERLASVPVKSYISRILGIFPMSASPEERKNVTRRIRDTSSSPPPDFILRRQDDTGPDTGNCTASSPCEDGSCCNSEGHCGFGPDNCGAGNCTANCDATAECGRDSLGGSVKCPLDVCCSYYGYCGVGDSFCSSPNPDQPCQQGFGSCTAASPPSCGGDSASGRSIAYYQVGNNYGRACQRISPSQINTAGLTHLNLAFASIDPSTFAVVPTDSRDVPYYTQFTALKSSTLQTWIAIGGWDFNDPGPTQTTFSDIASSASNRAAFISSLQSFMSEYGFQGVDIDWEYPGAPDRSGKPADTQNFVTLLAEMRAAFGKNYGISVTLPASYWYLRWFDPVAMEPYVDFFGLMTYDLHGPWDAEVKDVGSVIIGQTNIPEISNWTLPLWYDQVDPSKVNMGLAYYGRGYTVASVDCMEVGCEWSSTSNPAPCTAFGGVVSLQEIESLLIPELGIEPILDSVAMMKYLVWGNQWIGYDDLDTIAMKKAWASSHCFGGTMIWSIDLYSGSGSGDTPDGTVSCSSDPGGTSGQSGSSSGGCGGLIYIDPSIWTETSPEISCEPPCTFILPPLQLPTPTTVTFPPYVTSLDVAWSTSTGWTHIIQTTTLTIPPLVTTRIPFWEYTLSGSDTSTQATTTFYPTRSILPPPFIITDDPDPLKESSVTHPPATRTITPPPYPYSFTRGVNDPESDPIITIKPGPPGPICKSGCGTPCLIFCSHPCLLDCPDGGNDFADPNDPDPPERPTPPVENDPLPTGPTTVDPVPDDPEGDDPEDEDEEDLDDFCAYELDLSPPVYVDPDSGAGSTQTISPAASPPTPAPTPDPSPPSPNPATESLHCYNSGAETSRADMIEGVTDFCNNYQGTVLDASDKNGLHTLNYYLWNVDPTGGSGAECFFTAGLACEIAIQLSVTVTNGCKFTIDGPSPSDDCGRIFRQAIDKCDTSSTEYKQGGTVTSNCAVWNIDPNERAESF